MSVDLPAPFSPTSAWISPADSRRSAASLATTSPNRLTMPVSSTRGGSADAAAVSDSAFRGVIHGHLAGHDPVADRLDLGDDVGVVGDEAPGVRDVVLEAGQRHAALLEAVGHQAATVPGEDLADAVGGDDVDLLDHV